MAKLKNKTEKIKEILYIILITMLGAMGIVFSVLYVNLFDSGIFYNYSTLIITLAVLIISVLTILTIVFYKLSKQFIYKLLFLVVLFVSLVLCALFILKATGFLDRFTTVESFRDYISSFGSLAVILFIVIQFLQVVVLPIPSFITVGAGVLLFGELEGAIYSCIGIILGSLLGFFIGRVFGYKVAKWLVGKETLDKGLKLIKGKDKIIITFMFLFPFFPDDVICFVAGITTMSPVYFTVMIFITRIITIFISSYSMSGSIIPYNTWWGILIWIILFALIVVLTIIVYKNSEKIEKFFKRKKNNKNQNKND